MKTWQVTGAVRRSTIKSKYRGNKKKRKEKQTGENPREKGDVKAEKMKSEVARKQLADN